MDDNNEPLDQQLPVESVEMTRKVIIGTDGTITLVGGTREVATVAPDGGHQFDKTDIRVTTLDGHVLDHEHGDTAHHCASCRTGPYSRHAVTTCSSCQRFVCLACTTPSPAGFLCTTCYRALRKQAFKAFLSSIF